ncbi:MAG: hypothetical protein WA885_10365 [Phormidesmis sp.]
MKNLIRTSAISIFFGSCVGLFQTSQLAIFNKEVAVSTQEAASIDVRQYKDALTLTSQLPRLGFTNARANLTFLSFLQYFGDDQMRKQSGYGLSADFFRDIIADDPYYQDFYVFLTNSVSLNAAQPEKSVELMEKGLASLSPGKPDSSYYVWRYKGVEELLFLGDSKAAEHSFESAAAWARESRLPESDMIASISQQTADFLKQNPDSKVAQIGAWSSILTTAFDDETRGRAIRSIEALGGEVSVSENGGVTVKYAQTEQDTDG